MPKYKSRTGKDVEFQFKGNSMVFPADGYIESPHYDLEKVFPNHVEIYNQPLIADNMVKPNKVEYPTKIIFKEIEHSNISPIEIKVNIQNLPSPPIRDIVIPHIKKVQNPSIQEIEISHIKEVERLNFNKSINSIVKQKDDVSDFADMIEDMIRKEMK